MKKTISLILVFCMMLSLCGCDGDVNELARELVGALAEGLKAEIGARINEGKQEVEAYAEEQYNHLQQEKEERLAAVSDWFSDLFGTATRDGDGETEVQGESVPPRMDESLPESGETAADSCLTSAMHTELQITGYGEKNETVRFTCKSCGKDMTQVEDYITAERIIRAMDYRNLFGFGSLKSFDKCSKKQKIAVVELYYLSRGVEASKARDCAEAVYNSAAEFSDDAKNKKISQELQGIFDVTDSGFTAVEHYGYCCMLLELFSEDNITVQTLDAMELLDDLGGSLEIDGLTMVQGLFYLGNMAYAADKDPSLTVDSFLRASSSFLSLIPIGGIYFEKMLDAVADGINSLFEALEREKLIYDVLCADLTDGIYFFTGDDMQFLGSYSTWSSGPAIQEMEEIITQNKHGKFTEGTVTEDQLELIRLYLEYRVVMLCEE